MNRKLIVSGGFIANPNLSLKAKGLFLMIVHYDSPEWISAVSLARHVKDSVSTVNNALNELEKAYFLERIHLSGGRMMYRLLNGIGIEKTRTETTPEEFEKKTEE